METRIIKEETFYRIYDKKGDMACEPKDIAEAEGWIAKGKAPFLAWDTKSYYESAIRVWHKIVKAERVVLKVLEEIEPVKI